MPVAPDAILYSLPAPPTPLIRLHVPVHVLMAVLSSNVSSMCVIPFQNIPPKRELIVRVELSPMQKWIFKSFVILCTYTCSSTTFFVYCIIMFQFQSLITKLFASSAIFTCVHAYFLSLSPLAGSTIVGFWLVTLRNWTHAGLSLYHCSTSWWTSRSAATILTSSPQHHTWANCTPSVMAGGVSIASIIITRCYSTVCSTV